MNEDGDMQFWDAFPKAPSEFGEKVRQGIWFIVPVGSSEDRPVLAADLKLPQPPQGYAWELDPETLISGEAITFKLQRNGANGAGSDPNRGQTP